MVTVIDQTDAVVTLAQPPQRIVSLVPSITELLLDLGLAHRVVGRTKYCIHPQDLVDTIAIVGGTKTVDPGIIHGMAPDLIIASKEENVRDQVLEAVQEDSSTKGSTALYVSDVKTVADAYQMIADIALLTGTEGLARDLVERIKAVEPAYTTPARPALYLIWRKPYMGIGGDTFISEMMPYAGYRNLLADQVRYPSLSVQDIKALAPAYVLLSSEPFPFAEKHIQELQEILPDAHIKLVDGEHYSWYGSRMLPAFTTFASER